MRKILLNVSTLVKGGALQVACNLLPHVGEDNDHEWHFALSPEVDRERRLMGISLPTTHVHVLSESPSRSLAARRQLSALAGELNIDAVFTVFGPAYTSFDVPHLMGVADAWVTHSSWAAYIRLRKLSEYLRKPLLALYKGLWYRRADAWVVEAGAARAGLARRWRLPPQAIDVVPNNCGRAFRCFQFTEVLAPPEGTIEVLSLSAYYPHKLLELIPTVAYELRRLGLKDRHRFHVTLPNDSSGWRTIMRLASRLGVQDAVVNHGTVPVSEVPQLFNACHVMFLPTLLETFSASYPEAMAAGRPIVTSDLDFARSVCEDAALYFRAADAEGAATALARLSSSPDIWRQLVVAGHKRVAYFPDNHAKFRLYVQSLDRMLARDVRANRPISIGDME